MGYERSGRLDHVNFILARQSGKVLDEGTFHPGVMEGVERAASAQGLRTTYTTIELSNHEAAVRQTHDATHDTGSAVVLLGTEMEEDDYALFKDAETPLIIVDGWSDHLFFDCVVTSNENSAFRAVNYLINMGHRDIGYIAGDYRIKNFPLRERGYRRAMRESGIPIKPEFRVEVGTTVTSSYNSMAAWLATKPELPTAFFVENDIMALGCMRAMTEFGIKIPEDVSVFGFDDLTYASIANPPLSTVRVPNHEMGELAVKTLLSRLQDPQPYSTVVHLSTTFVERQSVCRL